jgi:hypothetical protein
MIKSFLPQLLTLIVGIAIIATRTMWGDATLAIVSGLFFLNICWVTLVLAHDLKIWAWLRNSLIGGIFMFGLILSNLALIFILAVIRLFRLS